MRNLSYMYKHIMKSVIVQAAISSILCFKYKVSIEIYQVTMAGYINVVSPLRLNCRSEPKTDLTHDFWYRQCYNDLFQQHDQSY